MKYATGSTPGEAYAIFSSETDYGLCPGMDDDGSVLVLGVPFMGTGNLDLMPAGLVDAVNNFAKEYKKSDLRVTAGRAAQDVPAQLRDETRSAA